MNPPSTMNSEPVQYERSSEARNMRGWPRRSLCPVTHRDALDVHGGIYVASAPEGVRSVFRVNTDGTVDNLFHDPDFAVVNFPSSLAFGTGKGFEQTLYVVNLAFAGPPAAPASLVTIDVGVPGKPLP